MKISQKANILEKTTIADFVRRKRSHRGEDGSLHQNRGDLRRAPNIFLLDQRNRP